MAASTPAVLKKLLFYSLPPPPLKFHFLRRLAVNNLTTTTTSIPTQSLNSNNNSNKKKREKQKRRNSQTAAAAAAESLVKRRTRSDKEFDEENVLRFGDSATHIPVMLGEVLEVFASRPVRSFVDCTLGAAGHSSAIIQAHPEMQLFVGLDVDPVAHEKAQARIKTMLHGNSCGSTPDLRAHILLRNFKDIKSVLCEVDEKMVCPGADGVLMDLGMSSMQVNNAGRGFSVLSNGPLDMRMDPKASLKAADILNSWPDDEVGRILREYGEESNWRSLQKKIVKARPNGGLHSTGELVDLIRNSTSRIKGGRQGWIKTATRVFQALRIAVNDELKTLEDSLYACFDCLGSGGRLAVISFHSLEDRIVKQTFLKIINKNGEDENEEERCTWKSREIKVDNDEEERCTWKSREIKVDNDEKEAWIKQMVLGWNGTILTKRPITPSQEEEGLNRRSRSAKLRVIQKV